MRTTSTISSPFPPWPTLGWAANEARIYAGASLGAAALFLAACGAAWLGSWKAEALAGFVAGAAFGALGLARSLTVRRLIFPSAGSKGDALTRQREFDKLESELEGIIGSPAAASVKRDLVHAKFAEWRRRNRV